jgi:hypothetical protein
LYHSPADWRSWSLALGVILFAALTWQPSARAGIPQEVALDFDGVDDHVEVPDDDALDLTAGTYTISAWIRASGWGQNQQGRIVDHGGGGGSAGWSLHLENKASNGNLQTLRFQVNNDGSFTGTADAGAILLDTWQHIAVAVDAGTITFFVDGVQRGVRTGLPAPVATTDPVRIGRRASDTGRAFLGTIDEVRIWNHARTQTEILADMDSEFTGSEPGLITCYRFNEGSGQSASDITGHGHDGRLGNSAGIDSQDPAWITSDPGTNLAPTVDAGLDQIIILPDNTAALNGTVTDDGLPDGTLVPEWTKVSGPGSVIFSDSSSVDTEAAFSVAGVYVVRLTADDGELSKSDDITVTVDPVAVLAEIIVTPNPVMVLQSQAQQFQAVGRNQIGLPHPTNPVWTATGGLIDPLGLYAAGLVTGSFVVTATSGAISGESAIEILEDYDWPTTGWSTATPAELGMDPIELQEARDYALSGNGNGFITRDGKVVMSWGQPDQLLELNSTTKSIGSIALGLALKDDRVALDDRAQQHLSSVGLPPQANADTGWLDDITLKNLGTQTGGFEKPGGYIAVSHQPGTAWFYSDGGVNWLADTLTVVFGQDLNSVLFNRVFTPLGITSGDLTWRNNEKRDDRINGIKRREFGSGITAHVDAMARIGYLYLRRGRWELQQILPESFIDEISTAVPELAGLPVLGDSESRFGSAPQHYGMLWWNNADGSIPDLPLDAYWAWGFNDSLIVVIPSLDIVAARQGEAWSGSRTPSYYQVLAPFLSPLARSVLGPAGAGEAGPPNNQLLVTDYDTVSEELSIAYGPACNATDNTIQFGPLTAADLAAYNYTGQACAIGNSGTYEMFSPGPGSWFFLVVGHGAAGFEGSYGTGSMSAERPPYINALQCPFVQDLSDSCD